jgi:hypothetical protein
MTTQASARFVATSTTRSNGSAFTAATIQGYYDATRKSSPLVVKTDSGTPSVSAFQLKAAGTWRIAANGMWGSAFATPVASSIAICRGGIAQVNHMAKSGSVVNPNVMIEREFSFSDTIYIVWTTPANPMIQAMDDANWVSFAYQGPM